MSRIREAEFPLQADVVSVHVRMVADTAVGNCRDHVTGGKGSVEWWVWCAVLRVWFCNGDKMEVVDTGETLRKEAMKVAWYVIWNTWSMDALVET